MSDAFDPIPSAVLHGQRFRAVFKSVYLRPARETFHEFLLHHLRWTLGQEWWLKQARVAAPHRHIVLSWWDAFIEKAKEAGVPVSADGSVRRTEADGPVWAILSLAWDIFSLASKGNLPPALVTRLRNKRAFQGARFELCTAGLLFRHGFAVRFLDDKKEEGKHCEFVATDRDSATQFGVEAKSRRRPGALHESGDFEFKRDARGVEAFIRAASGQKPEGLPFVIFVDVNLPESPDVGPSEFPWLKDVQAALGLIGEPNASRPDPFNAVILTNYCYHWGVRGKPMPRSEFGIAVSGAPAVPLDQGILRRIVSAVEDYGVIPAEV